MLGRVTGSQGRGQRLVNGDGAYCAELAYVPRVRCERRRVESAHHGFDGLVDRIWKAAVGEHRDE